VTAACISSLGYNLSSDTTAPRSRRPGDQQNTALRSARWRVNGGPTWTRLMLHGSPAIDAVPAASCAGYALDQRAVARPQTQPVMWARFEMRAADLMEELFIPVAFE